MDGTEDFTAYVGARWPRLVRSAVLLGCSPAEAEDVVQSALIKCLLHWRKVERAADQDAYVHRILINTFVSARRRRWSSEHATEHVPDVAGTDETAQIDQANALLTSLRRLNTDQRTAVVLRYYAELTEQQMADVLGVPAGTVKSRLSRALTILAADPSLAEMQGMP